MAGDQCEYSCFHRYSLPRPAPVRASTSVLLARSVLLIWRRSTADFHLHPELRSRFTVHTSMRERRANPGPARLQPGRINFRSGNRRKPGPGSDQRGDLVVAVEEGFAVDLAVDLRQGHGVPGGDREEIHRVLFLLGRVRSGALLKAFLPNSSGRVRARIWRPTMRTAATEIPIATRNAAL